MWHSWRSIGLIAIDWLNFVRIWYYDEYSVPTEMVVDTTKLYIHLSLHYDDVNVTWTN